jgi:glycosyltransferase involved in cell wall biosynthesis
VQSRPKILISAYACEPNAGSEPDVGWNWAVQAARHGNEVHVVTRANNRSGIESELAQHPVANLHFHYLDLPAIFRWGKKSGGYYGLISYYYAWQVALMFMASSLHRKHHFDLAHHVTFANDWLPSGLAVLPTPFIWGPVGGSTHRLPPQPELLLPRYARRHEWIRSSTQRLVCALDPFVALTRARATHILAYTKGAMAGIPSRHRSKARTIIHIGVSEGDLLQAPAGVPQDGELRLVMGGRLVHWKGYDLMLEGFARYLKQGSGAGRLIITGNGPYKSVLTDLVRRLDLGSRVNFVGRLPSKADVSDLLRTCSLYTLPTLRDGPPVAILEAMALGLPVLCLRLGSTDELVPDSAGLKINVGSREQVVSGIASALAWAELHRTELHQMGLRARAHIAEFHNWNRIGDEIQAIYEETLAPPRPDKPA